MRAQPDDALATLLKRLRKERDMTQEQLAFDAGITSSALSRIERGLNDPGWTTVNRIATALRVPLVDLVTAIEETRPTTPE